MRFPWKKKEEGRRRRKKEEEEGRINHTWIDPTCFKFDDFPVGVWKVLGYCLEGVWQVSGGCLVDVWRVSQWCLEGIYGMSECNMGCLDVI